MAIPVVEFQVQGDKVQYYSVDCLELLYTLIIELIYTLLTGRIDSILKTWMTQDVIDGPHCFFAKLRGIAKGSFISFEME